MRDPEPGFLIVVPTTGLDAHRSLRRAFADDAAAQVIVDRRRADRRARTGAHEPERRRHERRRGPDERAALAAHRWIAIPRLTPTVDFGDPDARAILFLCCSQHVVPCQGCQETYRIGWISNGVSGLLQCPRCSHDLTPLVAAHADTCSYWARRLPAPRAATG